MKTLVTGAAGFIGMHVSQALLARGDRVFGIDNLNEYYDPSLKAARLAEIQSYSNFQFESIDVSNRNAIASLFEREKFNQVVHLAAQAGVRYSLSNPHAYADSNLVGFLNILEGCRTIDVRHLVYASSSSVYGLNSKVPYSESDPVNHPVSLYAATKKAGELMAHSYSHLYGFPTTGLRFFTVYGPWGRPDMSPWLFTSAILEDRPINVFNYGRMQRDFTYIDDIVNATVRVLDRPAQVDQQFDQSKPNPATSSGPYRIYNIGNHTPVDLLDFIASLEQVLGMRAKINLMPMQEGDVIRTCADVTALNADIGFSPSTSLISGLIKWAEWYTSYAKRQSR